MDTRDQTQLRFSASAYMVQCLTSFKRLLLKRKARQVTRCRLVQYS